MINRRTFLTTSAAFGATLVGFPRTLLEASAAETVITILHTNDTHSQIDPLPANDRNAGKGGVARRATLVKRVRKENPNTLLIDAGDVLQGTPYFNFYKGEVEYKAMSAIGYDAGTLGNHEFDNGVEALAAALKFANFDIVSANYDVKGTVLEDRVKRYVVKTAGGIRVGLFGLGISPTALITPAVTVGSGFEKKFANGFPIATAHSPMMRPSELPSGATGSAWPCTRSTAMSVTGSAPTSCAGRSRPSGSVTIIESASCTTWWLVSTTPLGSITKPEPSPDDWRTSGPKNMLSKGSRGA